VQKLSVSTKGKLDQLLGAKVLNNPVPESQSYFQEFKADPDGLVWKASSKKLPTPVSARAGFTNRSISGCHPKVLRQYKQNGYRIAPRIRPSIRYTLLAAFCWLRSQEITDSLVELLIQIA